MRNQIMQSRILRSFILIFFLFLLGNCSGGDTPEDQIRRFVAAGEQAAEKKDIGGIKDLISEQYKDERGRTRKDIVAVAMRYFLANKNIHLLTRIKDLEVLSEKKALLKVYVAMSGKDVEGADSLLNVQADLYRFDLVLVKEGGDWQVIRADWYSALREDFY